MAASEDDMQRLITVIERQRRELDRMRAAAADESIVATARGVLMERLGLSPGQAASQLGELAAATGLPLAEMAAAVLSPDVSADAGLTDVVKPPRSSDPPGLPGRPSLAGAAAERAAELAADGAELADTLAAQLASLGTSAVALWLLEANGALALLGAAGLPPDETSRWRHIPPQLDCPAQQVAHGAADLWWNAGAPGPDAVPVPGRPTGARVALALRERNGTLLGVMEVIWPEAVAEFGTETRQRLSSLAAGCARVISTRLAHGDLAAARPIPAVYTLLDSVADSVLVAQAIRDAAGQLTDFSIEHVSPGFSDPAGRTSAEVAGLTLLEAYPASVSEQGLFAVARQVLADGVPRHLPADLRVARFFDGVIVTWQRLSADDSMAELLDHAQRLGRLGGWEEDLVTGSVLWTDSAFELFGLAPRAGAGIPLADLHSYVMAADKPVVKRLRDNLAGQREALTATFRFVHPDDRSVRQIRVFAEPALDAAGTAVALRGAFQDVSAHYHMQVALAATREQLADSEQRIAEEHLLAVRLQQAIMPPGDEPVAAAGIDVAVRYRPAGGGHLVGGDWYDTLLLPGKDVLLVVGDVAGHGIDAVTGMVTARNSLRALAITGAGPAGLVHLLNSVICDLAPGVAGTVVCGLYDPDTRVLRWARAGHLPPVLIRGETATELPLPGGVLLGMDPDARYEKATLQMRAGDTLLLFTDGLIEQRGESITDVLGKFVGTLGQVCGSGGQEMTAAAQADRILAHAASDTEDDACLVVVRIL